MKLKRKLLIISLAVTTVLCLCGAIFATNEIKMNIDENPVYARCAVDEVIKAANRDYSTTKDQYEKADIVDTGKVLSIEGSKSIRVTFRTYDVTVNADSADEVKKLSVNDNVTVYGKIIFKSENLIYVEAKHLENENKELSSDYYVYDGKREYNEKDSKGISLADGQIQFMIPNEWIGTEAEAYDKIFNSQIYNDNLGKCYYINRVLGGNEPEVFCIFYFKNSLFLKNSGDKNNTNEIEKAIVNNICPKDDGGWFDKVGFPTSKSTSARGVEFAHYSTNYDNYRIEFAFTPVKVPDSKDNEGICVMIHMYIDDSIRPDDVLYVMSTLSINK